MRLSWKIDQKLNGRIVEPVYLLRALNLVILQALERIT